MYFVMILGIIFIISLLIISLMYYIKYKLVPAFYMNLWIVGIYLIVFDFALYFIILGSDKKMIVLFIMYIFVLIFIFSRFIKSIKKGTRLRLNKKVLLTGEKIEINKLYKEEYKPMRGYYLYYYKGTYKDKNGKKHIFESEDYLGSGYNFINPKKSKIKKSVIIYVDPNDESKYYYKLEDLI
ncbi:MAG: hypothetical protein J6B98_03100 [Bacilli bacterium]|nr:hypothetical protein [Bacilli bacterium]